MARTAATATAYAAWEAAEHAATAADKRAVALRYGETRCGDDTLRAAEDRADALANQADAAFAIYLATLPPANTEPSRAERSLT